MRFLSRSEVRPWFEGRSVAIIGSGPGVLKNEAGFIDSHEVVVRVNNYRIIPPSTGRRTDVHYSFYGASIRKSAAELKRDGVTLCMCKCPNSAPLQSEWHRRNRKIRGVDFRYIYALRRTFWFCDMYVPTEESFLAKFNMLGQHIPTTGFSAIIDILATCPKSVYLSGFDFFRSGLHNISDRWLAKKNGDPICHVPERELAWLAENLSSLPVTCDPDLSRLLGVDLRPAA